MTGLDPFTRFLAAYPERNEPHDLEAAREAWAGAIKRARPETIIAGAESYRRATERRERRYIMGAARWLRESHWRDAGAVSDSSRTPPVPSMVWLPYGSQEWDRWAAFYRATKGRTPPQDRNGGWRFPSRFPPKPPAE